MISDLFIAFDFFSRLLFFSSFSTLSKCPLCTQHKKKYMRFAVKSFTLRRNEWTGIRDNSFLFFGSFFSFGFEVYETVQPLRFHISRNTVSVPLFCVILFMTGQRMSIASRSFAIIGPAKELLLSPDYGRRGSRAFFG